MKEIPKCLNCDKKSHFNHSGMQYTKFCNSPACVKNISAPEIEIYNYIKELNNSVEQKLYIDKREYDIVVKDKNLLIEFNGLYWHSTEIQKNASYHYNKWKLANENDYQLFTIWEDDWNYKQNLIKSMIKNKLMLNENTIYARKCEIQIVNYKDAKDFLDKNHIQGNAQSKFNLGLYYQNNLVSLMTFCKKRMIMKSLSNFNDEYELLRFCSVQNTSIIGGASKLFNYFIKTYVPKIIVSYADLDISDGNLYRVLGFNEVNHSLNYWWAKDRRYHRSNFMKHKLVSQGANPSLTEDEIMHSRGYMKIWGTGNLKFVWKSHRYIE